MVGGLYTYFIIKNYISKQFIVEIVIFGFAILF